MPAIMATILRTSARTAASQFPKDRGSESSMIGTSSSAIGPNCMNSPEADVDDLSLSTVLYQTVRANIESGRLPAGALLNEHRLAQQLTVSRAPVSRALQKLAADGVITRNAARGYRVRGADENPLRRLPVLELSAAAAEILRGRAGWEKIWEQVENDLVGCMPFGRFKLNELAMAEHYGVSRTVTRDLLGRLEARGDRKSVV